LMKLSVPASYFFMFTLQSLFSSIYYYIIDYKKTFDAVSLTTCRKSIPRFIL
jgi:hypothetical protein